MIALDRLQQIIPPDQALANKALSTSLKQIAGITNTNLPTLSVVTTNLKTTKDLPAITALTEAVPPSVANYYTSTLAIGRGPNGTVRAVDVIGLAGGYIATDAFLRTVEILSTMNVAYLTSIFQVIANSYDGTYGDVGAGPLTIPSGLPGAGTYYGTLVSIPNPDPPPATFDSYNPTALQAAMAVVVPLIPTAISALQTAYPTQTAELNSLFDSMAQQVATEQDLQVVIKLDYSQLTPNDRNSIYGFIFSLPNYGLDTKEGGMEWFIEAMADLNTQAGQAIVACMRQGQNQQLLGQAGITSNNIIPDQPDPPAPEAVLIPSEYSEAEAAALVIK
jgi:hypothetical protein